LRRLREDLLTDVPKNHIILTKGEVKQGRSGGFVGHAVNMPCKNSFLPTLMLWERKREKRGGDILSAAWSEMSWRHGKIKSYPVSCAAAVRQRGRGLYFPR